MTKVDIHIDILDPIYLALRSRGHRFTLSNSLSALPVSLNGLFLNSRPMQFSLSFKDCGAGN